MWATATFGRWPIWLAMDVFNKFCFKTRLTYTYFDLKVSGDLSQTPQKTDDMFGWEVARETLRVNEEVDICYLDCLIFYSKLTCSYR